MIDDMQSRTASPSRPARRRAGAAALVALLAALVALVPGLVAAPTAGAHGDEGVLSVVSATPSGTSSTVTVQLVYEGDGHPVDGATVTVVADDGAGATIDPVPMGPGSAPGQYTATVVYPSAGTWNLRVTAVSPAATLTLTQDVTADPGVAAPSSTADPATDDDVTGSPTTAQIGEAANDEAPETEPAAAEDEDEGSSPLPWILGGLAVVVCVGLGVVFVLRGRDQGPID
ncbi:FixH family protein [Dermatobacter hominis]|uniref:FixH family protein n=1 Tax=Dermatobacter hominis TaxID=2884263 RepID=UPI001D128E19|nr:FixH family protein [Dermatobacter hominis]UDY35418.1 FixH family protein [Dermatobacter hominis]